jgi:putative ABC transport system permease protein
MKERFGADLIVVPVENEAQMEAVLLKGEPSCFYFDKSVEDKIRLVEGVGEVTSQFFLTSLDAGCCDTRVQIIGFNPDTDFSVQPWINKVYSGKLEDGAVIIGSDISTEDDSIKFFDSEYKIAAKLDKTGTGLDSAVFATYDTVTKLYEGAIAKGQSFLEDANPEKSISSVLVNVSEGYDKDEVVKNIRKELGGVQIVQTQSMITGIASNIEQIAYFMYVFIGLFFIVTLLTLVIVFSVTVNERKKEFSILRTLGATRKKLVCIILQEAFYISLIGSVLGAVVGALVVFPFNVYIGDKLGLPYIQPSSMRIIVFLIVDLIVVALSGPLSAIVAALKISKAQTYITMRDGE